MSKAIFVDTKGEITLGPGESVHSHWNNTSPVNAVWSVDAVPHPTGTTATGFAQDTQLEVTRVWRRYKVIEVKDNPKDQFAKTKEETEIHYVIKNLGNEVAKFHVVLSAVYAG